MAGVGQENTSLPDGRPYKAERPLSKSICVKEERNGLSSVNKSHSQTQPCCLHPLAPTHLPCPALFCYHRIYLARTLPEVMLEAESSMLQMCGGSTLRVKMECMLSTVIVSTVGFLGSTFVGRTSMRLFR